MLYLRGLLEASSQFFFQFRNCSYSSEKRDIDSQMLLTEVNMDAITKLIKLREKSYVRKDIVFVFSLLTRASLKGTRGNRAFRSAELLKYCGIVS